MIILAMACPRTGAAAQSIADKVYRVARVGKLGYDIRIAMACSVARAVTGISRAV